MARYSRFNLIAIAGLLWALASPVIAQSGCTGQAPASTYCGNPAAMRALPGWKPIGIINVPQIINLNSATLPIPTVGTGSFPLQMGGADNVGSFVYHSAFGDTGLHNATPHLLFQAARGSAASPTAIGTHIDNTPALVGSTGDYMALIGGEGYDGSAYTAISPVGIVFRPTEQWTPSAHGSRVQVTTTPKGSLFGTLVWTFDDDGIFKSNKNTVAPNTPFAGSLIQLTAADSSSASVSIDTFNNASFFVGRHANGTLASPTAVGAASQTLTLGGLTWDGFSYNTNAAIDFFTLNAQTISDHSGYIRFRTLPSGSTTLTESVRIQASGGLSIGTTADPSVGLIYTNSATFLIRTKTSYNNGAGAATGTLTNAPAATNPTKWIPIDDNGTTRYIPAW